MEMDAGTIAALVTTLLGVGAFLLSIRNTSFSELKSLNTTLRDEFTSYKEEARKEKEELKNEMDVLEDKYKKTIDRLEKYIIKLRKQLEDANITPASMD